MDGYWETVATRGKDTKKGDKPVVVAAQQQNGKVAPTVNKAKKMAETPQQETRTPQKNNLQGKKSAVEKATRSNAAASYSSASYHSDAALPDIVVPGDEDSEKRLPELLNAYIDLKCETSEHCHKSDFDGTAREQLQRMGFLQALQAVEHFAGSVSARIQKRPAYLMGILRGQEQHWEKSRAAAHFPGGAAKLLAMPPSVLASLADLCLSGNCIPSDFTPEVCLSLQQLTGPLACKAVHAFNSNKRIVAGARGGVVNRPRFFQRLIQNVAEQNSIQLPSVAAPSASSTPTSHSSGLSTSFSSGVSSPSEAHTPGGGSARSSKSQLSPMKGVSSASPENDEEDVLDEGDEAVLDDLEEADEQAGGDHENDGDDDHENDDSSEDLDQRMNAQEQQQQQQQQQIRGAGMLGAGLNGNVQPSDMWGVVGSVLGGNAKDAASAHAQGGVSDLNDSSYFMDQNWVDSPSIPQAMFYQTGPVPKLMPDFSKLSVATGNMDSNAWGVDQDQADTLGIDLGFGLSDPQQQQHIQVLNQAIESHQIKEREMSEEIARLTNYVKELVSENQQVKAKYAHLLGTLRSLVERADVNTKA